MSKVLEIENLSKYYSGKKVLDKIGLELESGKILALLGPNGSGKTTLLKTIAGLIREDEGKILISEHKPGVYTKEIVSYLPDVNHLYNWMSVKDALAFFRDFYKDFDVQKANEMLKLMKISVNSKVDELSKGMLEKLMLILVLSRKAKLYLLDEPFVGIDPLTRDEIIDVVLKSYSTDSSIIISTHIIKDFERLFDEVVFFSKGKIVLKDNTQDLMLKNEKSIDDLYKEVLKNV